MFSRVTGEKGFFDSRVVFVDETGPKQKRVKRIALMDMDGAGVRYLTSGERLVVTPRFRPPRSRSPSWPSAATSRKVNLLNLETGQRETLGNFAGMSFAPRFSPDGRHVVMSLSDGSNSSLYEMDMARSRRRGSPTTAPSTLRRPIRRTGRRSCSRATAAAISSST